MWATPIAVMPFVKAGKVKALGVASLRRDPQLPDAPTFAESGLSGCVVDVWFGVAAPKGTSPAFVAQMSAAIGAITQLPEMQARMTALGFTIDYADSAAFGRLIAADHVRYGKVIREAGITPK
jgi:tripartite-type tricarboxylate transporter receptor subunit TctC